MAEIGNVRGFREYLERAVMKRRKWQASIIRLRYTGYKRFHRKILRQNLENRNTAACLSRLRHPPSGLPDPIRTGYAGRNSETELGSWAEEPNIPRSPSLLFA